MAQGTLDGLVPGSSLTNGASMAGVAGTAGREDDGMTGGSIMRRGGLRRLAFSLVLALALAPAPDALADDHDDASADNAPHAGSDAGSASDSTAIRPTQRGSDRRIVTPEGVSSFSPSSVQPYGSVDRKPYGLPPEKEGGVNGAPVVDSRMYDVPGARPLGGPTVQQPYNPGVVEGYTAQGYDAAYGVRSPHARRAAPLTYSGGPSVNTMPARPDFSQGATAHSISNTSAPYGAFYGQTPAATPGGVALPDGAAGFRDRDRAGNVVQQLVAYTLNILGGNRMRRGYTSLSSSFAELEDYHDIFVLAAGWNGDRYFQYRLGEMFETGDGVVSRNMSGAYYWYTLSAAQNFASAQERREELLTHVVDSRLSDDVRLEVYFKFIEIYVFGGPDAQHRLGQLLEGDFFLGAHDQDRIDQRTGAPRRRLVHAYAAYALAMMGGHPDAERALVNLSQRESFSQFDISAGTQQAQQWAQWIGWGETQGNPFQFTQKQTKDALGRGSDFQVRRGVDMTHQDQARSLLLSGRAYQSRGDLQSAKVAYEAAISVDPTSTAALEAQEALQSLTTTCSAARRDAPGNPLGKIWKIEIAQQQRALKALGFYEGPVDNIPGPGTRAAVRQFLRGLNVDMRDVLDGEQVVELICAASQLRGDPASQNLLGVMYTNAIGVMQDHDLAHYWFSRAAQQGEPAGIYNLGRMYAYEIGVPVKGHPQNCSLARAYLNEAKDLKHPDAARLLRRLSGLPACTMTADARRSEEGERPYGR